MYDVARLDTRTLLAKKLPIKDGACVFLSNAPTTTRAQCTDAAGVRMVRMTTIDGPIHLSWSGAEISTPPSRTLRLMRTDAGLDIVAQKSSGAGRTSPKTRSEVALPPGSWISKSALSTTWSVEAGSARTAVS